MLKNIIFSTDSQSVCLNAWLSDWLSFFLMTWPAGCLIACLHSFKWRCRTTQCTTKTCIKVRLRQFIDTRSNNVTTETEPRPTGRARVILHSTSQYCFYTAYSARIKIESRGHVSKTGAYFAVPLATVDTAHQTRTRTLFISHPSQFIAHLLFYRSNMSHWHSF